MLIFSFTPFLRSPVLLGVRFRIVRSYGQVTRQLFSDFPLPPPVVLVHLNPVTVWLDVLTLVWSNAFMLNLMKSVQSLQV